MIGLLARAFFVSCDWLHLPYLILVPERTRMRVSTYDFVSVTTSKKMGKQAQFSFVEG